MFCGKDKSFGPMSKEHFVPKALWDGERPQHTKTCPAHKSCNESFAGDNDYFRDVLVSEAGTKAHPEAQKLHVGKLKRKIENQIGSMRTVFEDVALRPVITPGGLYLGHAPMFRVDWPRINRVLLNVMKGIYYTAKGDPLPPDWKWAVLRDEEIDHETMQPLFDEMPTQWTTFGDDVFGCRYITNDEHGGIACLMQFFRRRTFFGCSFSHAFIETEFGRAYESLLIETPS